MKDEPPEEQKIDDFLCSKFKEFEARQTEILEKITDVERTFRESQTRLGLLQGGVNIITSELKFNPGKKKLLGNWNFY